MNPPCLLVLLFAVVGCGQTRDNVYVLYRSSPVDDQSLQRIHVATFDADGPEAYNLDNCEIAAELFKAQPGVVVKYWCEKGAYRP